MKPYTKYQLRSAMRIVASVVCLWTFSGAIAFGIGALKGHEERENIAAAHEAEMRQRIGDKWPELLSQAEYMTGMPATQTERK